jgi:hypothetical protein
MFLCFFTDQSSDCWQDAIMTPGISSQPKKGFAVLAEVWGFTLARFAKPEKLL